MMLLHSCRKGEIHTAFGMLPVSSPMRLPRVHCLLYDVHILAKYVCYGTEAWMAVRRIRKCPLKVPAETEIPFQLRPPSLRPLAVGPFDQNTQSSPPPPMGRCSRSLGRGTRAPPPSRRTPCIHRRFGGALSHTHIQSPSDSEYGAMNRSS